MASVHGFLQELAADSAAPELGEVLELAAQKVATVKGRDGEKSGSVLKVQD